MLASTDNEMLERKRRNLEMELFFQEQALRRLQVHTQTSDSEESEITVKRIQELQDHLAEVGKADSMTETGSSVDFIIVTALEEERDAVLEKLPTYQLLPPSVDDIRAYYACSLPTVFSDGSVAVYRVAVMPLLSKGRVQAAAATSDAIHRWHPRYVILVGIAGGIASKGIKLGDILVSDQIVDYELQKLTPKGPQIRWEVYRADPRLVGAAENFRGDDWQKSIAVKRPDAGMPKRHIGPIASGDKVVAFGKIMAKYGKHWPALIGVEMEAAGVAAACFQAANPPGFFMVRGVSDLADEEKGSEYVENWRSYACDIAASYAVALLKNGPVPLEVAQV